MKGSSVFAFQAPNKPRLHGDDQQRAAGFYINKPRGIKMLRRGIITIAAMSLLFAGSAFAGPNGNASNSCKDNNVVGSYTMLEPLTITDINGDNEHEHNFIRQLNLNTGGAAQQMRTTSQELMISLGTGSAELGSWACRKDGKLVVTLLYANYYPIEADYLYPGSPADLELQATYKKTYLFSVEDANTLNLVQSISRRYASDEDPTDPSGGTLLTQYEFFGEVPSFRLVPAGADLTP